MRARAQKGLRRLGYSLIEVMTAVAVMTVGATGIVMMQGATTRSNQDAYETSAAINFAQTWLERVRRDSLLWTSSGTAGLANTNYLQFVGVPTADRICAQGWFVPQPNDALESFAADYHGFDTRVPAEMRYCVNLNVAVLHDYNPNTKTSTGTGADPNALRVDVLVWWYRGGIGDNTVVNRSVGPISCGTPLTATELADPRIRRIFVSTVARWNEP